MKKENHFTQINSASNYAARNSSITNLTANEIDNISAGIHPQDVRTAATSALTTLITISVTGALSYILPEGNGKTMLGKFWQIVRLAILITTSVFGVTLALLTFLRPRTEIADGGLGPINYNQYDYYEQN